MAAHRIRNTTNTALPRCKSEGTLIDFSEGVTEATLTDVKGTDLRLYAVILKLMSYLYNDSESG